MLQNGHVHDVDSDIDVPVDLESPGEAQVGGLKAEDPILRSHQSHVVDSFTDSEIGDQPPVTRTGTNGCRDFPLKSRSAHKCVCP